MGERSLFLQISLPPADSCLILYDTWASAGAMRSKTCLIICSSPNGLQEETGLAMLLCKKRTYMLVCLLGEILERASPTSCGHTPPTPTRLLQPLVAPCTEPQVPLFFCPLNVCHAPTLQQAVCWGRTGQKCTGQSFLH